MCPTCVLSSQIPGSSERLYLCSQAVAQPGGLSSSADSISYKLYEHRQATRSL